MVLQGNTEIELIKYIRTVIESITVNLKMRFCKVCRAKHRLVNKAELPDKQMTRPFHKRVLTAANQEDEENH